MTSTGLSPSTSSTPRNPPEAPVGSPRAPGLPTVWVPRLLLATGIGHLLVAVRLDAPSWGAMAADGGWNSATGTVREGAFWFAFLGLVLVLTATLIRQTVRLDGRLPRRLGPLLLVGFAPAAVFVPSSGVWVVIAIGLLAWIAQRRDGGPAATPDIPPGRLARTVTWGMWSIVAVHLSASWVYRADLAVLVRDGAWNTVHGPERVLAFWFVVFGTALATATVLVHQTVRATGRLPRHFGAAMLATFLPPALLLPASGLWSLVAVGLVALAERPRAVGGAVGSASGPRTLPSSPA